MTPEQIEEVYERWKGTDDYPSGRTAWKAAWLEATRQAYADAIKICDEIGSENNPYADNESDVANACADAIRKRLKELDNGN